jgi:hypothetical protein
MRHVCVYKSLADLTITLALHAAPGKFEPRTFTLYRYLLEQKNNNVTPLLCTL